jgi:hypothetical protein
LPVGQRQQKVLGIDGKLCSANDFVLHRFPYCWHLGLSMRITSALYALTAFSSVSRSGRPFWALGSPPRVPNFGLSITDQTISMTSLRIPAVSARQS